MTISRTCRTAAPLVAVAALLLTGLTGPAQAASGTGSVKGVVTVDGKPLKGATIELYWTGSDGYEGKRLAVDTTNSKGAYSFSKFPIDYPADSDRDGKTIVIRDSAQRIVDTSRRFRDRAGRTVTRNASVKKAATITGIVKRGDGRTTSRLRVEAFGPYVLIDRYRETDVAYDTDRPVAKDGSFALRGLPAGAYQLQFVDDGDTYFSQCYDNLPVPASTGCRDASTTISVATGQRVTVKPQTLTSKGRRISGTVTDTSGRPIEDVRVRAVKDGEPRRLTTDTSKRGTFRVGPALDGGYLLEVVPSSPWAAPPVDARFTVSGQDVTGLRAELKSRARLTARLTGGTGTVTTRIEVTRAATGSRPSGTATFSWGSTSKTVKVVKGRAAAKLSRLPKGTRTITVDYSGTRSTAPVTKTFRVKVG